MAIGIDIVDCGAQDFRVYSKIVKLCPCFAIDRYPFWSRNPMNSTGGSTCAASWTWRKRLDMAAVSCQDGRGQVEDQKLSLKIFEVYPMTDPWCCYIWCSMDPINIPPMLAYIPAPWIRHGYWSIVKLVKQNRIHHPRIYPCLWDSNHQLLWVTHKGVVVVVIENPPFGPAKAQIKVEDMFRNLQRTCSSWQVEEHSSSSHIYIYIYTLWYNINHIYIYIICF